MTNDKFGDLNTGDMFRFVDDGRGMVRPVFRKASPREAVQQRLDGSRDMLTVDAVVKVRTGMRVERVDTDRTIRFESFATPPDAENYGVPVLANLRGGKLTLAEYTTLVSDESGEWQVAVTCTGRQDGKIAWLVLLVQCDDTIRTETGLTPYAAAHDQINRAIARLTAAAGWLVPLNKFTETQA